MGFLVVFMCVMIFLLIVLMVGIAVNKTPHTREIPVTRGLVDDNKRLRDTLNELDVLARTEYTVSQSTFSWAVSEKINEVRKELH